MGMVRKLLADRLKAVQVALADIKRDLRDAGREFYKLKRRETDIKLALRAIDQDTAPPANPIG
jgi:hypothetical protein